MTGRVTQRGISRWAQTGGSYRTVHRFFHSEIDWLTVKWLFFERFLYRAQDTYLRVGDETVLAKAGKKTFGLDRFFSCALGKPIPAPEKPPHWCLDKGCDNQTGEQAALEAGYLPHIRRIGEEKLDENRDKRHPARRWVVERPFAWLNLSRPPHPVGQESQ